MVQQDPDAPRRLDGWKAIAAYFNRDRTTAMRWARERGLPIRRMPGGKQGSVFAFEHELAAWALRQDNIDDNAGDSDPAPHPAPTAETTALPPPRPDPPRRRRGIAVVLTAMVASALAVTAASWLRQPARDALPAPSPSSRSPAPLTPPPLAMPRDPEVARDYVAARDHWAQRTPADLREAIDLYRSVIARDPGFAPAHAGLSEAWLILREYDDVDEATAFRTARQHAARALALDPALPAAYRAMGFIAHWWDGKPDVALARFRRALALDPRDGQTHFWLANILADLGADADAQAEYDKARILDPGSHVIEIEQACSHWQAGRDALALRQLTDLAQRYPDAATVQNCLAWLHISHGRVAAYADALKRQAEIKGEPATLDLANRLIVAARRDPGAAGRLLIEHDRRKDANGSHWLRETSAFHASALGDRTALVGLLIDADRRGERWTTYPITRRIARRWADDAEVQRRLAQVAVQPRSPGGA